MSFDIKQGAKGPTITLTRGDSCSFSVEISDAQGEPYELRDGDTVTFTVKKNTKTDETLIQKTFGYGDALTVAIGASETEQLKYGTYAYDLQLTYAGGGVDTFIGPADFILTEEVTF